MTRSLRLTIALLCMAAIAHVPAHADATSAARQAIQAGYNKMLSAMQRRDATAFLSYLTPDFKAIDSDGKTMDKAQLAKMFKQMTTEKAHVPPKMRVRVRQVMLHGKQATVLQEQMAGSSSSGQFYRDLWISTPKGWRIKQSHSQPRK